jgi:hypothetical protein
MQQSLPLPKPRCGATNHKGTHDTLDDADKRETAAQAAERLERESQSTKASILWVAPHPPPPV